MAKRGGALSKKRGLQQSARRDGNKELVHHEGQVSGNRPGGLRFTIMNAEMFATRSWEDLIKPCSSLQMLLKATEVNGS